MKRMFLAVLCLCSFNVQAKDPMTQDQMEMIVKDLAESSTGDQGVVEFKYQGMQMYLISDVSHDRMRIISPVAEFSKLSEEHVTLVMESNFHTALDARYALKNNVLYSAYIHPLSKLDEEQLKGAVEQVFNLKATFGGDYSSGLLYFSSKPTI